MPNDTVLLHPSGRVDHSVAGAALAGLRAPRKTLPASLFYDEEGCRLFYQITELPEYYLTRTEKAMLPHVASDVAAICADGTTVVEYGASDEGKAAYLLRAARGDGSNPFSAYVPIDVAGPSLERMRGRMGRDFPGLRVQPMVADFMQPLMLPLVSPALGFFPGSTIGNLDPHEAQAFLARAHDALGRNAMFLLGADLRKSPNIVLPAYNDAAGVTAAFNLNLLTRLNREAEANFDLASFAHQAIWNDSASRIEMHLISRRRQTIRIDGVPIVFDEAETIHTENSYKYPPERLMQIAAAAGWQPRQHWIDDAVRFGVFLLQAG